MKVGFTICLLCVLIVIITGCNTTNMPVAVTAKAGVVKTPDNAPPTLGIALYGPIRMFSLGFGLTFRSLDSDPSPTSSAIPEDWNYPSK